MHRIRLTIKIIRVGLYSFLFFWIFVPLWGQEHPGKAQVSVPAPLPELIDVWDTEEVRSRSPILIAHRGGVVDSETPECSKKSVKLAAAYQYDMVELDIQESLDHHPVVFHDRNMIDACGIDGKISDYTLESLTRIHFLNSTETVSSLDTLLEICQSLNLGVMFDIKAEGGSELFFKRVVDLIDTYKMEKACMTIGSSRSQEKLKGKVLQTITPEMLQMVKEGEALNLHGYYWFGVPKTWPIDLIKPVQERGALVIPAINTFRYSEDQHRAEAYEDVERLLEAGVDGFQIDCIYQDYFD
jgi:glycerophosphoryl diester phosphodiesterase